MGYRAPNDSRVCYEDLFADAAAVRDTAVKTSGWSEEIGGGSLVLVVENGANQQVSVTLEWTPDNGTTVIVAATFTVAITTNAYHDGVTQACLKLGRGKFRAKYSYAVAPASGAITIRHQRIYFC